MQNASLVPGPNHSMYVSLPNGNTVLAVVLVDSNGNLLATTSNGNGTASLTAEVS